jgi:hypothetical protein
MALNSPPPGWDSAPSVGSSTPPPGWNSAPSSTPQDNTNALVSKYAAKYGVPEDFANRIRGNETGGTPSPSTATSTAGARGIYQLMPGTFREMGVGNDITNPEQNVNAGLKYLGQMLKRYGGDQRLAAAAYNAGPGAVDAAHGVPNIAETQNYVKGIGGGQTTPPPGWDTTGPVTHDPSKWKPGQNQKPPGWSDDHADKPAGFDKAPAAPPAKPQPQQDAGGGMNWAQGLVHGGLMAGTNVMGGLNAVLGAGQRAVAGALTGDIGAAVHPFDEARQNALEAKTEALPGIHQASEAVGAGTGFLGKLSDQIMQAVGHPTHNEKFLGNVGKVFTAQALTDPLSYVPLIGEAKMANGARRAWELASKGAEAVGAKVPGLARAAKDAKDWHEGIIQPVVHQVLGTRPKLDPFLDPLGKAARLSIEKKGATFVKDNEGVRQTDLAHKHESEIRNAKTFDQLPKEVQQEAYREGWRYGTPQDRADAEAYGFHPTQEDTKKFPEPLGLMKYEGGLRKDYITLISPKPPAKYSDLSILDQFKGKPNAPAFAGFEKKARTGDTVHDDMYDRLTNRWRLGRSLVKSRMVDQDTKDFLLNHGGSRIPATPDNVDAIVSQLDHGAWKFNIPRYSEKAQGLARGGIQLNPFPHGLKNVGDLASLEGGPAAFGKGLAYAAKGLTPEQMAWHKNVGTDVDFLREAHGPITKLASKIGSQGTLQRLEMGYRQALKDHYDATMGPSKSIADDYVKAQKIRDALGDYENINAFTAILKGIGGPFVAFRTGVTPKAVGRALRRAPQRVEARARASEDINQELHKEGQPGSWHYGGPVEDMARMGAKSVDYGKSAATIGPILSGLANLALGKEGPQKALTTAGESFIPALQEIMPLLKQIPGAQEWLQKNGLAYHEPAGITPMNDALNTVFGSHFENPTSATRRREIEAQSRGTR